MTDQNLRELDAWLHYHVFKGIVSRTIEHVSEIVPHYSSPSGFFLLLDKLITDGYGVRMRHEGSDPFGWIVSIHSGLVMHCRQGDLSLPVALCLAAKIVYSQPREPSAPETTRTAR